MGKSAEVIDTYCEGRYNASEVVSCGLFPTDKYVAFSAKEIWVADTTNFTWAAMNILFPNAKVTIIFTLHKNLS